MKESEITALAREYAEWVTEAEGDDNAYIPAETAMASVLLRWLSRRYCLVEKGKLSEMYDAAMEVSRLPRSVEARGYAISRLQTLKSLFPEIAKEVEDGMV